MIMTLFYVMQHLMKKISFVILAAYAALIIFEIAGVRVHHGATVELFRFNPGHAEQHGHHKPGSCTPCNSDETPMEHVMHFSVSDSGNDKSMSMLIFSLAAIFVSLYVIIPASRILRPACNNSIIKSINDLSADVNRAPPSTCI